MNNTEKARKFFLRSRWKFWEYVLIVTGGIFGYGNEIYYKVKNKRNAAYFCYTLYS